MNRRPFNRTGFNRPMPTSSGNSGSAVLKMTTSATCRQDIRTPLSRSSLALTTYCDATTVKRMSGSAVLTMTANAIPSVGRDWGTLAATLTMSTFAEFVVQGETAINLPELILAPGDELVINTDEMTITINGQNGIQYFSMDSDFFKLLNGENIVVYNDSADSRNVLVDILWKDRWL